MKKRIILLLCVCLGLSYAASAQNYKKLMKESKKLFFEEQYGEALKSYNEVLYINKNNKEARYKATICSLLAEDEPVDISKLEAYENQEEGKNDRFYNYFMGKSYYRAGQYEKAQMSFEKFMGQDVYKSGMVMDETVQLIEESKTLAAQPKTVAAVEVKKDEVKKEEIKEVVVEKKEEVVEKKEEVVVAKKVIKEVESEESEIDAINNIGSKFRLGNKIELRNIHFGFDEHIVDKIGMDELDKLAIALNKNATIRVEIEGHTDNVGSDIVNLIKSNLRAEAVVEYLISKGVAPVKLVAKGYGETKPYATNDTAAGRKLNRRVEVIVKE